MIILNKFEVFYSNETFIKCFWYSILGFINFPLLFWLTISVFDSGTNFLTLLTEFWKPFTAFVLFFNRFSLLIKGGGGPDIHKSEMMIYLCKLPATIYFSSMAMTYYTSDMLKSWFRVSRRACFPNFCSFVQSFLGFFIKTLANFLIGSSLGQSFFRKGDLSFQLLSYDHKQSTKFFSDIHYNFQTIVFNYFQPYQL